MVPCDHGRKWNENAAEVQELRSSVEIDENVAWLGIAMHDEVLVGIVDRGTHFEKEGQAIADVESLLVAVVVDEHPLDVLHDKKR